MTYFEQERIRRVVSAVTETAEVQADLSTGEQVVKPADIQKHILWGAEAFGLILGLICWFCTHILWTSLLLPGFFSLICIPGLILWYHSRIWFGSQGFVVKNFWGLCRHYDYQDIRGICYTNRALDLELPRGKHLKIDATMGNRSAFYGAIRKCRGDTIPACYPHAPGMTESEMADSYQNGMLREVLIVPEPLREDFLSWKRIYWLLCGISLLSACLALFLPALRLDMVLLPVALFFAGLWLYLAHPEAYSTWELPHERVLADPILRKFHKRSPTAWPAVAALFNALLLLASLIDILPWAFSSRGILPALILAFLLPQLLLPPLCKHLALEHRKYPLGLLSFRVSCFAIGTALAVLILALSDIFPGLFF